MISRIIRRVKAATCAEKRRSAGSILVGKPEGDPMKEPRVGGTIILKWVLKK
jgi:hypothetical protein